MFRSGAAIRIHAGRGSEHARIRGLRRRTLIETSLGVAHRRLVRTTSVPENDPDRDHDENQREHQGTDDDAPP
jgi:hypothetical protein